jgi:hypothetical protein
MLKMNLLEALLTKLEKVDLAEEETIPHVCNLQQGTMRHVLKTFRLHLRIQGRARIHKS